MRQWERRPTLKISGPKSGQPPRSLKGPHALLHPVLVERLPPLAILASDTGPRQGVDFPQNRNIPNRPPPLKEVIILPTAKVLTGAKSVSADPTVGEVVASASVATEVAERRGNSAAAPPGAAGAKRKSNP